MNRRNFFQKSALVSLAASALPGAANAFVPAHNWDGYDFGSGPEITDRLNQGPFPTLQTRRYCSWLGSDHGNNTFEKARIKLRNGYDNLSV